MSRNGSGTYTLPAGNPVVTGTTISSTWANSTLTNIASALTDSLAADGQTTATGNLKMGNNRITGLANGIASTDAASLAQVTSAVAITGGTINGTSIGATTASTGRFTTLEVTTTSTFTGNGSFNGTGALKIPVGTTAQQPTPVTGQIRYNTTNSNFEGYYASGWGSLGSAAGSNTQVQYNNGGVLAGSSGLTFNGTTLQANALTTDTLNATSGVLATQNGMTGIAKAWIQYDGSTQTINGSFNISSVTYSGTGSYTLNFTTAMANGNYAVSVVGGSTSFTNILGTCGNSTYSPSFQTTSVKVNFDNTAGTQVNPTFACIAVFGS